MPSKSDVSQIMVFIWQGSADKVNLIGLDLLWKGVREGIFVEYIDQFAKTH